MDNTIKSELTRLFDIYKACQAGQKEKLNELFETEQDGSLSFKDICLKKLLSAVRCTFGSEEKNPQAKHKKYYAGHFDSSDVDETLYLVITEIFYAVPDSDGCIEIDNVKSKIPVNNASSLMKNISFFIAALCNFHGAKIEKEVSENVKTNDSEKEIVLTDYKPPQKLWQVVRGKVSRRMECAEILRLLQKDMYGIFELFKSDSISIRAAVKTVLEKPETFKEMKEAEGLELLQHEELCKVIFDHTGVKIQKTNVSMIFSTVKKKLMEYIYICTEKHKSLYSLDTWNVIMLCLYGDSISFKRQIELHEEFRYWWESAHYGSIEDDVCRTMSEIIDYYTEQEKDWLDGFTGYVIEDRFKNGRMKLWKTSTNTAKNTIKLSFYSSEEVKHPVEVSIDLHDITIYEGIFTYYVMKSSPHDKRIFILPKNLRKELKNKINKAA